MKRRSRLLAGVVCCSATAALALTPASPAASINIDQGPILKVLRSSDVPDAENTLLPSGALTLDQLAAAQHGGPNGRKAEGRALDGGFRSAAISEFLAPGSRRLCSLAVKFVSAAQAADALGAETAVAARYRRPLGTRASIAPEPKLPGGKLIAYRPRDGGKLAGVTLLARSGTYVFILQGSGDHGGSSRSYLRGLLKTVMQRG